MYVMYWLFLQNMVIKTWVKNDFTMAYLGTTLIINFFLLHPEYRDNFFIQSDQSISFAQLNEWMIYYFCAWFKRIPTSLLGELQNYRRQDFPFDNISLKQFRNGILGFWILYLLTHQI